MQHMEKCFRTSLALWMFLLVGNLQANPVHLKTDEQSSFIELDDLGLDLLHSISCDNTSFISPINIEIQCQLTALRQIRTGMEHARKNCNMEKNTAFYLNLTLEYLESLISGKTETSCNLTTRVDKKFEGFLNAIEDVVDLVNTHLLPNASP